jgi:hypothetical protein
VVIGVLFDVSLGAVTAFCVAVQLAAIPLLVLVRRRTRQRDQPAAGQPAGE